MSDPLINNFESMMAAGESEASKMNIDSDAAIIEEVVKETVVEEKIMEEGVDTQRISIGEIKDVLKNMNFADMLNHVKNNPGEIDKIVEQSMNHDMINEARKIASGCQGDQIRKEMQRRGIDSRAMKEQFIEQKKVIQEMTAKNRGDTKRAILITASKQMKPRDIQIATISSQAHHLVKSDDAIEISCSRLAYGAMAGKTIKAWYDPNRVGRNARASKIVGFSIAGDLLIIMDEGDISDRDFLLAEKQLV